ncbi:Putative phosphoribosyl transferase [Microbulbifer aggregans]|uniref:Phosphoribosyl transferase n=1 Tax=Microbulbifer aggregans TaxID=1769779 RepID=A0A1C9W5N2_9GAMM|nr:phosphoribosyltransferase [Microbulbifer aggregans]AOS96437.1 Putative phosphoribosyl transferase [Microbulbifer aggregans]
MEPFTDRTEAGRRLAQTLTDLAGRDDVLLLALPRGGVPVGLELARALRVPLDLLLVRKLGVPGHEELAMGAVTANARVLNDSVLASLGISEAALDEVTRTERQELERRSRRYRGDRSVPKLTGKTVVLVDDGIATGATMEAAARAVREENPAELILAVPVAPPDALHRFAPLVDRIECLMSPQSFWAIGAWYRDFSQLTDEQVLEQMREAERIAGTGDE